MAKLTKTDEFLERLGIEMDHVKAGQRAGKDVKKGLERAAEDLKKAVDDAYARLK
jgi:hypothetical protein